MEIFLCAACLIAIAPAFPTDVTHNGTKLESPIITTVNQSPRVQRPFTQSRISVANMYRSGPIRAGYIRRGTTGGKETNPGFIRRLHLRGQQSKSAYGSKATIDKVEDIFTRGSRDNDQETHNHPVASEGTCMCFNRIFRTRTNRHFEPMGRRISTSSSSSDQKVKGGALQPIKKTTISVGWRNNHSLTREDVTQQAQQVLDDSLTKSAENGSRDSSPATVRVLRVADLIEDIKSGSPSPSRSSPLSHDIDDDLILELQQAANEESGGTKRNIDLQPPWLESIHAAEKAVPTFRQSKDALTKVPGNELPRRFTATNETSAASTDKNEDDGYYFLSYSGGTANRTTATKGKREPHTYDEERTDLEVRGLPQFGPFRRLQAVADRSRETARMQNSTGKVGDTTSVGKGDSNMTTETMITPMTTTTLLPSIRVQDSYKDVASGNYTNPASVKRRQAGDSADTDNDGDTDDKRPPNSTDVIPVARGANDTTESNTDDDGDDDEVEAKRTLKAKTTTEPAEESPDPSLPKTEDNGNPDFFSMGIGTAFGLLAICAICCYCTRPSGAFCYNFLRKPGQPTRKQKREQEAIEKEARQHLQAEQKKIALKAQAEKKQQDKIKMQEQKEKDRQKKMVQQEIDRAKAAVEKEKKMEALRKQKEKDQAKKDADRIKKEAEKVKRDEEKAKKMEELEKQRAKEKAAKDAEKVRKEKAREREKIEREKEADRAARAKAAALNARLSQDAEKRAKVKTKEVEEEPMDGPPKQKVPRPGII